jgi:glycosyltransferase involved in cell wall biosynthesis
MLKVVWLCYFSNQLVQDKIKPRKRVGEIAPWITNLITLFENDDNVELHVISQHRWINRYKCFKHNRVTYHFFNPGIPFIGRHWPGFFRFDLWTGFFPIKIQVSRIINRIKPDIIHLHGTENEFGGSVIQFYDKFPVFITIQGFIHKSLERSKVTKKRIQNELSILRKFNHFGYRTETMGEEIKSLNVKAALHWHNYPVAKVVPINIEKKFDLVFFARICKDKGIDDLLKAVSIIRENNPNISLCVIGGGKLEIWKEKARELNISENVYWAGFLPAQKDVHKLAESARISVLPTYNDIISGTIIESLFLKLPVVAYNVGSIKEVNKNNEIISLVEKGDIDGLARAILILMNDEGLRIKKAEIGYIRIKEMFCTDISEIRSDILKAYDKVISDFNKIC